MSIYSIEELALYIVNILEGVYENINKALAISIATKHCQYIHIIHSTAPCVLGDFIAGAEKIIALSGFFYLIYLLLVIFTLYLF